MSISLVKTNNDNFNYFSGRKELMIFLTKSNLQCSFQQLRTKIMNEQNREQKLSKKRWNVFEESWSTPCPVNFLHQVMFGLWKWDLAFLLCSSITYTFVKSTCHRTQELVGGLLLSIICHLSIHLLLLNYLENCHETLHTNSSQGLVGPTLKFRHLIWLPKWPY